MDDSAMERFREALEGPDDARAVLRDLAAVAAAGGEREEVDALEPQGLVRRDLGNVDVAAARLPLAVGLRALPRGLLVHGHLPLQLHVVEDGHLLTADDRDPPHLV